MKKQYKIDLHTHSIISHDGGIKKKQYKRLLDEGILDYVAITDHNETSFARALNKELGDRIIIGEEIKTTDGEIIGLFLQKTIPQGLTPPQTVAEIREQGGLVYVPHPFETARSGLQEVALEEIAKNIDIIEVFNARGYLRGKSAEAQSFSDKYNIAKASSSDSHCLSGSGTAYSVIGKFSKKESLVIMLNKGNLQKRYAPWYTYLCPGYNKIKNKLVLGV